MRRLQAAVIAKMRPRSKVSERDTDGREEPHGDNALSYTGRTLVLHGESACPTRMVSLSYTEKRIFPLHGAEGVTQGNSTDPLRLTKAAKCQTGQGGDNCTKWFLAILAIIKTPFAMRSRQAAMIAKMRPRFKVSGRDDVTRPERGFLAAPTENRAKTGAFSGRMRNTCRNPAFLHTYGFRPKAI